MEDSKRRISERALQRLRKVEALMPTDSRQLHRFVEVVLGLRVPRRAMLAGHAAPFDYLRHAFFSDSCDGLPNLGGKKFSGGGITSLSGGISEVGETSGGRGTTGGGDCVVWANRGGGKTMLGAVATLLDLVFKPGIQVRILGGSREQSDKMFRYLVQMMDKPIFRGLRAGEPTSRRLELVNGSVAELLAQSQRSVRGQRVHKIRCDEVEEFQPGIWDAAQLVTRSGRCGRWRVRGTVEALSTMHRPFGLMHRLTSGQGGRMTRVFRWCALDVMERCREQDRSCEGCALGVDCRGRARTSRGYMAVEDLLVQRRRSSAEVWASEMLCQHPRRSDCVYSRFSLGEHVRPAAEAGEKFAWVAGMDFGLRSPLAMLWARVDQGAGRAPLDQPVHVLAEYVEPELTLGQHLQRIARRGLPRPQWVGVDPAGQARNSHTGSSDIQMLQKQGYKVRWHRQLIQTGIQIVRRRLDQGTLLIDPSCHRLIEAMCTYHFDLEHPENTKPVKDGPDHLCDALRYLLTCLERGPTKVTVRDW